MSKDMAEHTMTHDPREFRGPGWHVRHGTLLAHGMPPGAIARYAMPEEAKQLDAKQN